MQPSGGENSCCFLVVVYIRLEERSSRGVLFTSADSRGPGDTHGQVLETNTRVKTKRSCPLDRLQKEKLSFQQLAARNYSAELGSSGLPLLTPCMYIHTETLTTTALQCTIYEWMLLISTYLQLTLKQTFKEITKRIVKPSTLHTLIDQISHYTRILLLLITSC